jgi:hypothetical protein
MALAERSAEDVKRFVANTAAFSETVKARNAAPMLQGDALREMIDTAAKIDLSKIGPTTTAP